MRLPMSALLLLLAALAVAQNEAVLPADVEATLAGFHEAIVVGDLETARGYLSPLALRQAHFAGMSAHGDPMRLPEAYVIDSLEHKVISCRVTEKYVGVEYDLTMKGAEKKTGEDVELTWRRAATLEARGPHWRITDALRTDPVRAERIIKDGVLKDEDAGVEVAVPEGWSPRVTYGSDLTVTFEAPNLGSSITVAAADLPVAVTAEAIADMEAKGQAAFGITGEVLARGASRLGGRDAYEFTGTVKVDDLTLYVRRAYHIYEAPGRRMLYALVLAADGKEALDTHAGLFETMRDGIKLTPPREVEVPAELGKIVDGKYLNPACEISMDLPPGWTGMISQSRFLFQLVVTPPEGESNILLGAVNLGQWVDPKLAVYGDLAAYKAQDPNLQILEEGDLDREDVQGYRLLLQMTLADNVTRKREVAFFMRGTTLYFAILEAVPGANFEALEPLWDASIGSLTFGPIEE